MKRLMLSFGVVLVTFAFGVGIDRLIWHSFTSNMSPEDTVNPVPLAVVETAARLAPIPPATPPPVVFDYTPKHFNPDGAYYWMGPQPKGFEEFSVLELLKTGEHGDESSGYMAWLSTGATDNFSNHPAIFGLVAEKRVFLILSATPTSAFEYRFDGEFVRTDFEAVDNEDITVLKGTITKMKNGQTVAEASVRFRFAYMGC